MDLKFRNREGLEFFCFGKGIFLEDIVLRCSWRNIRKFQGLWRLNNDIRW